MSKKSLTIALAGNPNSGKTTLFNSLTGAKQYVGNWPGVTVEKKEGPLLGHEQITLVDLPGIYSLSPYTPEEVVARDFLIQEKPDVILNIVDGTNLERNLYLSHQLIETGIPMVIAINLMDAVRKKGENISVDKLSQHLACPVLGISALKNEGIEELLEAVREAAGKCRIKPLHYFSGPVEHALAHIEEALLHDLPAAEQRWYAVKLFERDEEIRERFIRDEAVAKHIEADIRQAETELDDDAESIIINERYSFIENIIRDSYEKKSESEISLTEKIDRILTNRWVALPIFALVMSLIFYISVATVGHWAGEWTSNKLFGEGWRLFSRGPTIPGIPVLIERALDTVSTAAWLKSLILDGMLAGVGAVLSFVPQMAILFLLLGFLELSGYMSRVAFILDRLFRRFGLSGKSFIPMLVCLGCGVPGIMATRTIESERDRRMTLMTTTFMPCGAKMPLIALISSSLFGGAWWVTVSAYFIGIAAVVISGVILKKTKLFAGDTVPFVMELPEYRLPTAHHLFNRVWEQVSSFIIKAGTIILLSSVFIWLGKVVGFVEGQFVFDIELPLAQSILGQVGQAISFVFAPLGFGNAQASLATLMGFIAKEEIVMVFGVLRFNQFSRLAGFSFMIFNLLCAPCIAAISAMRREMQSARWTWIALAYMTGFAYAVSLMIYQFGQAIKGTVDPIGLLAAVFVLTAMVYHLLRKPRPSVMEAKGEFSDV